MHSPQNPPNPIFPSNQIVYQGMNVPANSILQPQFQLNQIPVMQYLPNQNPISMGPNPALKSIINVFYEPEDCCTCCSNMNPKRGTMKILIDNIEVGSLIQGQSGSYQVTAGTHTLVAKIGGIGGFFASLTHCDSTGQFIMNCQGGGSGRAIIRWEGRCCVSKYVPLMIQG